MAYSFQTETSIAEWHYMTGMKYMDAKKIIELLDECPDHLRVEKVVL